MGAQLLRDFARELALERYAALGGIGSALINRLFLHIEDGREDLRKPARVFHLARADGSDIRRSAHGQRFSIAVVYRAARGRDRALARPLRLCALLQFLRLQHLQIEQARSQHQV